MSKREGDAEVGAAAAVDQQPKKKSRSAIATAPGTSRIPVLPTSTSTNKADMASSSSTTPATAASTTQYAFGARLVKESKVAGSLKEGKSKEIRKEVVLKRSSNAITSAPKDDARDAVNEKHAALLKQSNDFLEMAENFKLKAEIELLQSKLGQLEGMSPSNHHFSDKKDQITSKIRMFFSKMFVSIL
ncbi:hypothetical protein AaE_008347 [Aphanomyces astaci]|uniref:No apical meristem-associated C-terminal domain-containing protein n=1 Tax=Aphanomyces astaci TaxID=112090 RepID=A0A6A5AFK3_APHAT|nr:hypothetical protein AaE_008347 [Aphanomyces astaci]